MDNLIIPAESAKRFVNQMRHYGLAYQDIFKGTELNTSWLAQPEAKISVDDYIHLVKNGLNKTNDLALGMKFGKWYNILESGALGYAVMNSTTAGEVMNVAVKYWKLRGSLTNVTTEIIGDDLIWIITPVVEFDDMNILTFAVEEFLSTFYGSCHILFYKNIGIREMHLAYPKPGHAGLYRLLTTAPIYFDTGENLVITPADTMSIKTLTGLSDKKGNYEKYCQELLLKLKKADKFIEEIRWLIIESKGRFPGVEEVAQKFDISPRTLFRKLQERGTTYQKILDEVRTEIARNYLEKTNLSIDQISELIGFAETTTFRRAFKKWAGISPSEFRKKNYN